jgi:hypothetical protein
MLAELPSLQKSLRLIRITSGNLRLLTRLLTQNERVNGAQVVSLEIVEAARDSLVIGQA